MNIHPMSVERHLFSDQPEYAPLLRMLLALDGSTTRVCEALACGPVQLQLLHQAQTIEVPVAVREQLGGQSWLVRVTSLHARGHVLMDNLSYTRLDAVPAWFLSQLEQGQAPIGHLLERLFVRREKVPGSPELAQQLWQLVQQPDVRASRHYRISTPEGALMQIFEVYRAGIVQLSSASS
jgi:chorismate-pyruvate lyase